MKTTIGAIVLLALVWVVVSHFAPGSELTWFAIVLLVLMFAVSTSQRSEIEELKAEIWWLKNPEEKHKQIMAAEDLMSYDQRKSESSEI